LAPLSNEASHSLQLLSCDGLKRVTEACAGSGFNLCEDQAISIAGNNVNFATRAAPVSLYELITDPG
jgi:hypothetical protein